MPTSGDRITPEAIEQERNRHAMALLGGIHDSFGFLVSQYIQVQKKTGQSDEETLGALVDAQGNILEFLRTGLYLITTIPRIPRKGKDRVHFAQGQHAGVSVQLVSEPGLVTRMNFYGALRDPGHHMDEHDSRRSNAIHSDRTLASASQTAHVDLHMIGLAQTEPFLDLWLTMNLTRLQLSAFIYEQTPRDVITSVTNQDTRFKPHYSRLDTAMRNLAMMVPNPYSPR